MYGYGTLNLPEYMNKLVLSNAYVYILLLVLYNIYIYTHTYLFIFKIIIFY